MSGALRARQDARPSNDLGIYVHYPWCRKRCPYCDFAVEVAVAPPDEAYLDAVLREFDARQASCAGRQVRSIYLGGGTPSLWDPACIQRLLQALAPAGRAHADAAQVGPTLEITIEANPRDCQPARLAAWAEAGITRISLGLQSFEANELAVLGRDHRLGDGLAALDSLLADGRFTISVDVILGVPTGRPALAPATWAARLAARGVGHISVYELTVEAGAAFGKRVRDGRIVPRDEDELADLYVAADAALTGYGYEHYEISSYALPGQRAIHNSLYWNGGEFIGLGVGAASLQREPDGRAIRQTNARRWHAYTEGHGPAEVRAYTAAEAIRERLWLGLRTADGVDAALLDECCPAVAEFVLAQGLATAAQGRVRPTLRGFLFADQIAARIESTLS